MSLKAINEYIETHGISQTIKEYANMRQRYYEGLSTFDTFGKGWTRRVSEVTEKSMDMI